MFFLFSSTSSFSQVASFSVAYDFIFRLQFTQADSVIARFEANTFEIKSKTYLNHASLFFRLATNSSNQEIENKILDLKRLTNEYKSENYENKNEWYFFCLAEMCLQQAMLLAKIGLEWDAFKAFNQSKTYARKSTQINARFYPVFKTLGLIELLQGAIPQQYSSIARFFGFEGNTNSGFQKLMQCYLNCKSNQEKAYRQESAFIMLYASANFSNLKVSLLTFANSLNLNEIQPLVKLALLSNSSKNSYSLIKRARVINSFSNEELKSLPYLNFIQCDWHIARNELDSAKISLAAFKSLNKVDGFECRFWQRKAWIHFLNKEYNQYQLAIKNLKISKPLSEDDYQVLVEINEIANLNPSLLKSRCLLDQGFWEEAKVELSKADTSSIWNKKEYHYRLGRIAQLKGETITALHCFEKVNSLSKKTDNDYFGAYAFYYSAEILFENNQTKLAENKLTEALQFNKHAYQKSLSAKINQLFKNVQKR